MAPDAELSTTVMAWVGSTFGAQAAMIPASVAKMKRAGPDTPPLETTKSFDPLNTMPVGRPPGMETTRDWGLPAPSYRVATPLPLDATQTKPNGLKAIPQPLTRFGSVCSAAPGMSETRLRTW